MNNISYQSTVSTNEAIAATVAAYEFTQRMINNHDIKKSCYDYPKGGIYFLNAETVGEPGELTFFAIRDLATKAIGLNVKWLPKNVPTLEITDEHREEARKIKQIITNSVVMATLRGVKSSSFNIKLAKQLEDKTIGFNNFGFIAYAAKTANTMVQADQLREEKANYITTSKALGMVGDKISATITILSTRHLPQYDSNIYNAHDNNGSLIMFFRKLDDLKQGETYKVTAKIKKTELDSYSFDAMVTQLNYVKIK